MELRGPQGIKVITTGSHNHRCTASSLKVLCRQEGSTKGWSFNKTSIVSCQRNVRYRSSEIQRRPHRLRILLVEL